MTEKQTKLARDEAVLTGRAGGCPDRQSIVDAAKAQVASICVAICDDLG